MIRTERLTKRYGSFTAVDSVNLDIQPGEIYGFLGPNGAGKTSTIKMLLGIVRPTEGEMSLFGERSTPDRLDLRKRIGVVPEKHPVGMWSWMTATEYLQTFADIFSVENAGRRIERLLDQVGLLPVARKRFSEFSHGMLQKLSFVRALLHDPDILFLDEPISGLDPFGVKQIRDLILEENRDGRTIFISSHILSEMEKVCHRVGIIYRGRLMAQDAMKTLLDSLTRDRDLIVELEEVSDGLVDQLRSLPFVISAVKDGNRLIVTVPKSGDHRKRLLKSLAERDIEFLSLQEKSFSLEDAFVTITRDNIARLADIAGDRDE